MNMTIKIRREIIKKVLWKKWKKKYNFKTIEIRAMKEPMEVNNTIKDKWNLKTNNSKTNTLVSLLKEFKILF